MVDACMLGKHRLDVPAAGDPSHRGHLHAAQNRGARYCSTFWWARYPLVTVHVLCSGCSLPVDNRLTVEKRFHVILMQPSILNSSCTQLCFSCAGL